jgi:hypothetical protein
MWGPDLKTWLSGPLEEKGDTAVVGVGTSAHVDVVLVGGCCGREDRGVV